MTLFALPLPAASATPPAGRAVRAALPVLAEHASDLSAFPAPLVREIAATATPTAGPFAMMAPATVDAIASRHQVLNTHVVTCHLLLHRLHEGTGTAPLGTAALYAADQARHGTERVPLLALLLLAPAPVLARAWADTPPGVDTVEAALDRWDLPSLIEIGTAMTKATHPAFLLGDAED